LRLKRVTAVDPLSTSTGRPGSDTSSVGEQNYEASMKQALNQHMLHERERKQPARLGVAPQLTTPFAC